jgi:hypothetical protein
VPRYARVNQSSVGRPRSGSANAHVAGSDSRFMPNRQRVHRGRICNGQGLRILPSNNVSAASSPVRSLNAVLRPAFPGWRRLSGNQEANEDGLLLQLIAQI